MSKIKNTFGLPDSLISAASQVHETSHLSRKQKTELDADGDDKITGNDFKILRNKKLKKDSILEYDYKAHQPGQYPFSASQLTPLFTMIRTLLDFVQKTPALKKLMRDETGIDDDQVKPLIEFFENLHQEIIEKRN